MMPAAAPTSSQPQQPQPQAWPPNPNAAVSIRGLFKHFDRKIAVNGLALDIPIGSFYGLVGPNGAGKTTTLNMVTGLLVPDAGTAMILGHDVWSDVNTAKRMIGVMPQPDQIFDRLTGLQLLVYSGMLRGMSREETTRRAQDLLNAFDLAGAANTMVTDYSAGMTKKICLASAMIHSPRILVLDEPFESVDPVSSANLKDILIEYAKTGGTVIISSHVMALVEKMCTRGSNQQWSGVRGRHGGRGRCWRRTRRPLPATGRRPPRSRPSRVARWRAGPSPSTNFGPAGPSHSAYARHTYR